MPHRTASLWSRREVGVAGIGCGFGLLVLVIARVGIDDHRTVDDQLLWLDLAVLGTVVAAAFQTGFVILGHHRIRRLRDHVLAQVPTQGHRPISTAADRFALVTVEGGTWLHRATCEVAAGKAVRIFTGDPNDVEACELCGGAR